MWECPNCNRVFKITNQSHSCVSQDISRLFEDKSDDLILCFDTILSNVLEWKPNYIGAATNTIVLTSKKAWLIIKPMKKELDVKFYYGEELQSSYIKKVAAWGKKYAHHIRISSEHQIDAEFMKLLKKGFDYSLNN